MGKKHRWKSCRISIEFRYAKWCLQMRGFVDCTHVVKSHDSAVFRVVAQKHATTTRKRILHLIEYKLLTLVRIALLVESVEIFLG